MIYTLASLSAKVKYYLHFYQEFLGDSWRCMTPMQYGMLLVFIGVFGWLLMKTAFK